MSFVYPAFLYALFALAIPVIIHLFNFRKFKRVFFTNVKFLKEVKQETQSRSKLKHLIVLAMRMLAIAFLVFAFAQPYIPVDQKQAASASQAVSIYIDNSFSMDGVGENGQLIEVAKNFAREITENYQSTDQFQLLTNDFEGRHQRLVNKEEVIELIDEIEISPNVRVTKDVILRQREALKGAGEIPKTAYLLSDFQESITRLDDLPNDTAVAIRLIPLKATEQNNIYIDSCWFATPVRQLNLQDKLHVRIRNSGETAGEDVPLKLFLNDNQKSTASFSIAPGEVIDTVMNYTITETGLMNARVELKDYPITYDDQFHLSYEVAESIPVMVISETDTNKYLKKLFLGDPFFELTAAEASAINYSSFTANKLLVIANVKEIASGLREEITKFVNNGGHLLVFPGTEADLESYSELLLDMNMDVLTGLDTNKVKVGQINTDHPLFENVFESIPTNMDLPVTSKHFHTSKRVNTNGEFLLKLETGENLLTQYDYGQGKVYLSSVALDQEFSNFPRHALFVPILYKIALNSNPTQRLYYSLGKDESVDLPVQQLAGDNILHIQSMDGEFDFIPEHRILNNRSNLFFHNQISLAGHFKITSSEGKTLSPLAINYNRKESNLEVIPSEELKSIFENAGLTGITLLESSEKTFLNSLSELREGKKYWRICIILTLVFLAFEVLLLKFWK